MTDLCVEAMVDKAWADFVNCQSDRYFGNRHKLDKQKDVLRKFAAAIAAMHSSRPVEDGSAYHMNADERAAMHSALRASTTKVGVFVRPEELEVYKTQASELSALKGEIEALRESNGYNIPAWTERQSKMWLRTPLDNVFADANAAIEGWGAHPDLTSAQNLVGRAWSFINRWIESGAPGASDKARQALTPENGK